VKVHVLQHVAFEGLGSIEPWLAARNATIGYTRFHEQCMLPDVAELDLVIAMGGPMSVNDELAFPWLKMEKQFVREAIHRGVAVLGVCLGAQLIASALGARIYANPRKEIGWFEIEATPHSLPDEAVHLVFQFPKTATVFHWHGETFDLPTGATRLARSAACENQAFQLGSNAIGLQFHLETTPESADAIIANCRHELVESTDVQSEATIRTASPAAYARINQLMADVLTYLTRSQNADFPTQ
jgi:GMP synthase-like glutamine amidotransferase